MGQSLAYLRSRHDQVRENRKGCHKTTIADDPEVVCLAATVLPKHGPTGPIIPAGSFFRKSLGAALTTVGINTINCRPFSLRRGGATHHWQVTGDMRRITKAVGARYRPLTSPWTPPQQSWQAALSHHNKSARSPTTLPSIANQAILRQPLSCRLSVIVQIFYSLLRSWLKPSWVAWKLHSSSFGGKAAPRLSAARGAQGWIPSAAGLPEALRVGFLALISPRPTRGWLRQTWLARQAARVRGWAFHQWSRHSWAFHHGADIAGPSIGADIAGPSTNGANIAHLLLL